MTKLTNPLMGPSDWFNFHGSFPGIFEGVKNCNVKSDTEVCMLDMADLDHKDLNKPTFILKSDQVHVAKTNPYDIPVKSIISKFMLLTAVKFKHDYFAAMSYVLYNLMKHKIPYIRVGVDYFKLVDKTDIWGKKFQTLKAWNKETITSDHTKSILSLVNKFDDFTIIPCNTSHVQVVDNCYNIYSKFQHEPVTHDILESDLPATSQLLMHIFGDQVELGLKYMKVLYENPKQILPVLSLVSTERETGKTTFLNWMQMIFGQNSVLITPNDLTSPFNSHYATKNIIMIDETAIEKSITIEKLKSLATAKSISISEKFVSQYSIPFFGKIIMCTNKEKDFMRIDKEEIRFWVRKIHTITGIKNTNIESDLAKEIPAFLKALKQMPKIDFLKSRMVFTKEEISTSQLDIIKEESKSTLFKDIEMYVETIFNDTIVEFEATAIDIKHRWFNHNNQISISYIRKVLKDEMKLKPLVNKKYYPFGEIELNSKTGTPFLFVSPKALNNDNLRLFGQENDQSGDNIDPVKNNSVLL